MLEVWLPFMSPVIARSTISDSLYSQIKTKILPAHFGATSSTSHHTNAKWGYKDLLGNWIIKPQYNKANKFNKDGIAEVILENNTNTTLFINDTTKLIGLIDLKGNILASYKSSSSQKRRDKKYGQALEIVSDQRANGMYNDIFTRIVRTDSILEAKELLRRQADSIAAVRRIADSIYAAKEREIITRISSGKGLSLSKVKVTGHGGLLSKDETWHDYTIRMDDFNRIYVTYEGSTKFHNELDVLKTIYESDWNLLPDNLFQSVEIRKLTVQISQGYYTKKFGAFSFLLTLNIDNFHKVYTDKEVNIIVSYAVSQVEKFISSFIIHYQNSAYSVEPLLQTSVGSREGIIVRIVDKKGDGELLEDAKRICKGTQRALRRQIVSH